MGIELSWEDDEKTILRHTYDGHWSVEDFITAVDTSRALLLEVGHPVDLIIDMGNADGPPQGIASGYQYADRKVPQNQGLVIMVNPNAFMKAYNRVVSGIAPRASQDRHVVETPEDALQLIREHRTQIESQG